MKKKLVLIVTALTLCAVMVVGATLAYLTDQTRTLENVFVFDSGDDDSENGLKLDIAETRWSDDPNYQFQDVPSIPTDAPGTSGNPNTTPNKKKPGTDTPLWGDEMPFYDTASIDKNPSLKNNTHVTSYVGAIVTLPADAGVSSWEDFAKLAELRVNGYSKTFINLTKAYSKTGAEYLGNGWYYLGRNTALKYNKTVGVGASATTAEVTADALIFVHHSSLASSEAQKAFGTDYTTAQYPNGTKPIFDYIYVKDNAADATFAAGSNKGKNIVDTLKETAPEPGEVLTAGNGVLRMDVTGFGTQARLGEDATPSLVKAWNTEGTAGTWNANQGAFFALNKALSGIFA